MANNKLMCIFFFRRSEIGTRRGSLHLGWCPNGPFAPSSSTLAQAPIFFSPSKGSYTNLAVKCTWCHKVALG